MGRVYPRQLPWYLPVGALVLTAIGSAFILSAHSAGLALRHLAFAGVGCVAFLALAALDYRHLTSVALLLYGGGLVLLAGLPLFGMVVNSARRWYDLGFISVQPSEPMKYLLVIALADYFRNRRRPRHVRDVIVPLAFTGIPMAMIAVQPDVGTALLLAPTFFVMAFLAGVPVRRLVLVAALGCAVAVAGWFAPFGLKPYQKERIVAFVRPELVRDSRAAAHGEQVIRAIRAGGLWGEGWGQGVLNRRRLLSERHTDFIFAVIAEEWGYVRTAGVVCIYLTLIGALGYITVRTRDRFGRLIAGGVLCVFGVQSLLNMAIAVRLAPITGMTLPLVSYGGSSMVSTFAGLGLAASVRMRRNIIWTDEAGDG